MDETGLVRAGRFAVNRRVALGYIHRIDLANDLPITDRTLADIENGAREVSVGSYAVLENKLGWAPGSFDAIRAGGEPTETVESSEQHEPSLNALRSVPTEDLLLELRRRVVMAPASHGEPGWGALLPLGDAG